MTSAPPEIAHAATEAVNAMKTLAQGPYLNEEADGDGVRFAARADHLLRKAILASPFLGGPLGVVDSRVLMRQHLEGFTKEEREALLDVKRVLREQGEDCDPRRLCGHIATLAVHLGACGPYIAKDPIEMSIVRFAAGAILPAEQETPA